MSIAEAPRHTVKAPIVRGGSEIEIPVPPSLRVIHNGQTPKGCGCMRVINRSGDDRIVWDCGSLAEIREAKQMFEEFVSKGLVPYRVEPNGKASSEVMEEFDPSAEEVIFLPMAMVVGG